jgi:hypothetical protein
MSRRCTAVVRGTPGKADVEPHDSAAEFSENSTPDHDARIIHEQMIQGKAHGSAYDDVGHFESLTHVDDRRPASVVMTPF